jgi:GR25 family glycosyltransferase involved in LPS biosynthesis
MKVLIIHNVNNEIRKQHFLEQFAIQGITDYEIIPAQMIPKMPRTGISRSHKKAVRRAIELNLEEVIIMEDDVLFYNNDSFKKFIHGRTHVPADYDMYLGGIYQGKLQPLELGISKINGKLAGMHAYFLNKKFYEAVLNSEEHYNLDHYLSVLIGGNFYTCDPLQIIQKDGYSDNTKSVTQYNTYLKTQYKLDNGDRN